MIRLPADYLRGTCIYGHQLVEGNLTKNGKCLMCARRYRGYKGGVHNRSKTHCPKGHEFSGDNLRIYRVRGKPRRICVACKNEIARNRYWKKLKQFHMRPRGRPKFESGIDNKENQV